MRQQWCPGRFSSPPQKRPGNEANRVCDRPSMHALALSGITHVRSQSRDSKMASIIAEASGALKVAFKLSVCIKGSCTNCTEVALCNFYGL